MDINKEKGFTIIPLILLIAVLGFLIYFFFTPKNINTDVPIEYENVEPNGKESNSVNNCNNEEVLIDTSNWTKIYSKDFGISFKIPNEFYWDGGQTSVGKGPMRAINLRTNANIETDNFTVSCNLQGEFLKDTTSCVNGMEYESISVTAYLDGSEYPFIVSLVDTPSWVSFESQGCGSICKYRYDDPVCILGKEYKVKVAYEEGSVGDYTWAVLLEEEVPAGENSKWKYFGISPFLGFADGQEAPLGVGLSKTSRAVLSTLQYE